MVKSKAYSVPDSICHRCSQCWEGECRAFKIPHSEAERRHRLADGAFMACRYRHPDFADLADAARRTIDVEANNVQ